MSFNINKINITLISTGFNKIVEMREMRIYVEKIPSANLCSLVHLCSKLPCKIFEIKDTFINWHFELSTEIRMIFSMPKNFMSQRDLICIIQDIENQNLSSIIPLFHFYIDKICESRG